MARRLRIALVTRSNKEASNEKDDRGCTSSHPGPGVRRPGLRPRPAGRRRQAWRLHHRRDRGLEPWGNFDVLLAAVLAADPAVASALADSEQYTVFAPTDQAFVNTLGVASEAEAIATVQSLPQGTLTDILLYHVIDGRRTGTSVLAAPAYEALLGQTLTRAELVAAGVQAANISASNGVVHVLTTGVLIP